MPSLEQGWVMDSIVAHEGNVIPARYCYRIVKKGAIVPTELFISLDDDLGIMEGHFTSKYPGCTIISEALPIKTYNSPQAFGGELAYGLDSWLVCRKRSDGVPQVFALEIRSASWSPAPDKDAEECDIKNGKITVKMGRCVFASRRISGDYFRDVYYVRAFEVRLILSEKMRANERKQLKDARCF